MARLQSFAAQLGQTSGNRMQLLIEAELSPAVKRFEILIENVLLTAVPTRPLNNTKSDLSDFTSAGITASNANWYSTEQVPQAPQQAP